MQSNIDQRVLKYTLLTDSFSDLTAVVNEATSANSASVSMLPGDYLYVSAFLPFNHKFFKLTAGEEADPGAVPLIELLNAPTEWTAVVDQIDYTGGFSSSGVLQWTPNWDSNWGLVSQSNRDVPALQNGPVVYQAYWLRISFPDPIAFGMDYVGQKFSSDADLYAEYPMLNQTAILSGWKVGKADWEDQHILAATYIAKELIQRNLAVSKDQILDISTLRSAAVHKTAHIIYSGLGVKNYAENIAAALKAFELAMKQDKFGLDVNGNARKDREEVTMKTTSRASR